MDDWTTRFEENRDRLHAIATRMLGSRTDADDALQEAWLRVGRADTGEVDNPAAWLTTIVSRVCLTMLQARRRRETDDLDDRLADPHAGPEDDAVLADSVGVALQVVLDQLAPAERLAFVLHDLFAVPFEDVAQVLHRTPAAARQLASRGRRRVRGAGVAEPDRARQRAVVAAFLAASREGRFEDLLALLEPDAELRPDAAVLRMGAPAGVRGAAAVAGAFSGRAKALRLAWVDDEPALVWAHRGVAQVVFRFAVGGDTIRAVDQVADRDYLDTVTIRYEPERRQPS